MKSKFKTGTELRNSNRLEALHLFRWFTLTDTLPQEGGKIKARANEMKMRMKGNEDEVKMKTR